jgi:hypothetical protein
MAFFSHRDELPVLRLEDASFEIGAPELALRIPMENGFFTDEQAECLPVTKAGDDRIFPARESPSARSTIGLRLLAFAASQARADSF